MRLNIHSITSQINEHNGEMNNMKILSGRFILIGKKLQKKQQLSPFQAYSQREQHIYN